MSVVNLVTKPAVENLSILEKENVWILSNIAFLKFLANPVDAIAAYFPHKAPPASEINATTNINNPIFKT